MAVEWARGLTVRIVALACLVTTVSLAGAAESRPGDAQMKELAQQTFRACRTVDTDKFIACADQRLANLEANDRAQIRALAFRSNWQASFDADERAAAGVIAECRKRGIAHGAVRIGMTAAMVRECGWGAPENINRTTTAQSVDEQWVYGRSYLYFTNGRLRAIQN